MKSLYRTLIFAFSLTLLVSASDAVAQNSKLHRPDDRSARTRMALVEEVRHQLLTLPYYGLFDWLEAAVEPDGRVVLSGQVVRPTTKDDAESRIKRLEAVNGVVNRIEVLPLSTFDDQIRLAMYRRIAAEPGMTKYFIQAVPPIHIIVNNGRVTLKGIVDSPMDSQLAYMAASSVPNVFEVKNELRVENSHKIT
jgi:hyperosmotically inducible periplasmic protein